jgi:tetratricopeptide (TPR) repeat protein
MSKPTAMTFPVLAGLLDYLLLRKVRWQALYVPAVMALACGMIASYSQMSGGAKAMLGDVPLWGRLLNAVAAIGDYCWKTVWPADLMIPYLHTWPSLPNFFWPGLALCVLYGLVLLWSGCRCGAWQILTDVLPPSIRRGVCAGLNLQPTTYSLQPFLPALFVGLAWFIVAVAPMLGLANFGYHSHADRFTYLPGIGFALIVAVALAARRQARRCFRLAAAAGGAAALLTLGAAAWRQATVWKDDPTLYRHTLAIDPGNYVANRSLGLHYCGHGPDYAKAAAYFDEAFRVNRECNRVVQIGYVVALAGSGALGRAKEEARDLAELHERNVAATLDRGDPLGQDDGSTRSAETFIAYGIIAYYEGDRGLARQHAETVLGRSPDHAYAHYILGLIARDEGRREEAVERWKISAGSDPITLRPFLERWIAELERQETSNHVWQAR